MIAAHNGKTVNIATNNRTSIAKGANFTIAKAYSTVNTKPIKKPLLVLFSNLKPFIHLPQYCSLTTSND